MTYVQGVISYPPAVSEIVHHVSSLCAMISHCIAIKTSVNATYIFTLTLDYEIPYRCSFYRNISALINPNMMLQMCSKRLFASL
jgi:hypothetical protein